MGCVPVHGIASVSYTNIPTCVVDNQVEISEKGEVIEDNLQARNHVYEELDSGEIPDDDEGGKSGWKRYTEEESDDEEGEGVLHLG